MFEENYFELEKTPMEELFEEYRQKWALLMWILNNEVNIK